MEVARARSLGCGAPRRRRVGRGVGIRLEETWSFCPCPFSSMELLYRDSLGSAVALGTRCPQEMSRGHQAAWWGDGHGKEPQGQRQMLGELVGSWQRGAEVRRPWRWLE